MKKQVNISQALEQELDGVIKEIETIDIPPMLVKSSLLQLVLDKFIKTSFFISNKAYEYNYLHYGNIVKILGTGLDYLAKQKISLNNKATAFIFWCNQKRITITGWDVENLIRIDANEMTKSEFKELMLYLTPNQYMTFIGLQDTYMLFTEAAFSESYNLSGLENGWLELLNKLKNRVAEIPFGVVQDILEA